MRRADLAPLHAFVACRAHVPETLGDGTSRFGLRHAARHVLLDAHLRMERQLVGDVALDVGAPEREIPPPCRDPLHADLGVGSRRDRGEHRAGIARPRLQLAPQLRAALRRQRVELRPSIISRRPPLGADPLLRLEPMECRVEGALLDAKHVVGRLLDPPCDSVAMNRPAADGLEDEQIKRTAQDLDGRVGHRPLWFLGIANISDDK